MSESAKTQTEGKPRARDSYGYGCRVWFARRCTNTVIGAGLACVDEVLEAERVGAVRRALRASGRSRGVAWGTRGEFAGAGWKASSSKPASECAVLKVTNSSYRAGGNGARGIRSSSVRWSRWC